MRFKMPETLDGLSIEEVTKLRVDALAEARELNAIEDDKITAEESAAIISLVGHLGTIDDKLEELGDAETSAEQLAAARAALLEADEAEAAAAAEAEGAEVEGADAEVEGAEVEAKELIVASGAAGRTAPRGQGFGAKVAKATVAGATEIERDTNRVLAQQAAFTMTAAANVKGFNSEQELKDFDELALAYGGRSRSFQSRLDNGQRRMSGRKSLRNVDFNRKGAALSDTAERYSVATLHKAPNEFVITDKMSSADAYALLMRAASENRLSGQSLTAAGGWCSPSDIVYGFLELETAEGLLNIAEIQAPRGGIQFTKGPQLGELLIDADLGWVMTEAQAEAGTFTKPVFDIECPDWDEVRMDAVGYALRAGLLTNATFPELLRRYLALALIVHARRMNKLTIDRIRAAITATMTLTSVGAVPSATADLLDAIELGAMRIREQYSMGLKSTVEAVFPLWVKMIVRSDLARRNGDSGNLLSVTDQQIEGWFKQRQINPQFVRDYQSINNGAVTVEGGTAAWTTMPTKVEFMLYPAGSYVRLATDVIDLDTVYDQDNLTKNQFMAAFYEEGFGVANTGASGVKVTVLLPNRFGVTGAAIIGDPSAVAPTP